MVQGKVVAMEPLLRCCQPQWAGSGWLRRIGFRMERVKLTRGWLCSAEPRFGEFRATLPRSLIDDIGRHIEICFVNNGMPLGEECVSG